MGDRRGGSDKDGHEYRITLGIFAIAGYFNGVIDALTDDFVLKFFLAQVTLVILFSVAVYEMSVMDAPKRPILASILLSLFGVMGYIGVWHYSWVLTWVLARGALPTNLWLAPNVYMDLYLYSAITGVLFVVYSVFVVLVNVSARVKQVYMPVGGHRRRHPRA